MEAGWCGLGRSRGGGEGGGMFMYGRGFFCARTRSFSMAWWMGTRWHPTYAYVTDYPPPVT